MRVGGVLVAAITGFGLLTACGSGEPPTVNYLVDAKFSTYNPNTPGGNADGMLMPLTRVLAGFSLLGPAGQVIPDRDVGTVTPVPGPSLTLRYDFNPKAVFSDGHAMTCDDVVLSWAAQSGRFDGFTPATTAGYRDIESVTCTPGARSATVAFAKGRAYRDWISLFGAGALLPAHVVARDAGVANVVDPIKTRNRDSLAAIAKSWNTGFALHPGQFDAARFLSSGPYVVAEFTSDGELLLKRNEKFWGDVASTPNVTVWSAASGPSHRPATGGYDVVDVADGAVASVDGKPATESLGPAAVSLADPRRALGVDQIVLQSKGVFAEPSVRQAFASCVPRDQLTQRFGRGAQMWNLRFLSPADQLASAINSEFGKRFLRADLARARQLLGARPAQPDGKPAGPVRVRMAYRGPDERRAGITAAIVDSCKGVGITVVDAASDTTTTTDLGRTVDAMLVASGASFAAAGANDPARGSYQLRGGDPLNIGDFRDPPTTGAVDALAVTTNAEDRLRLARSIETAAWRDLASIPLFATPRQQGFSAEVRNIVPGAARSGTGWNMDRWQVK